MKAFIITVKYPPKSELDSGLKKYRVNSLSQWGAVDKVMEDATFPPDGKITRIRKAAYKRR